MKFSTVVMAPLSLFVIVGYAIDVDAIASEIGLNYYRAAVSAAFLAGAALLYIGMRMGFDLKSNRYTLAYCCGHVLICTLVVPLGVKNIFTDGANFFPAIISVGLYLTIFFGIIYSLTLALDLQKRTDRMLK